MPATASATQPSEVLEELRVHNLLVPVDGAEAVDDALEAAVAVARHHNAAITLLAVVPDARRTARRRATIQPGVPFPAATQEAAEDHAHRRLLDAIRRIPHDIPVTTIVRHGHREPELMAELGEHEYDAIMLGAPVVPPQPRAKDRPSDQAPPVLGPVAARMGGLLV